MIISLIDDIINCVYSCNLYLANGEFEMVDHKNIRGMAGSFQSGVDRESLINDIQEASSLFKSNVKKQAEEEQMSLRDITKAENSGQLSASQRKSLGLSEKTTDTEGELLSEFDIHGDGGVKTVTAEDIKREEHEAHAKKQDINSEDEKEEFVVLDDGTKICNTCGTVVYSPQFIEISDEELMEYFMGGRIIKQFDIGPISILLRSLSDSELDFCGELMARDVDNKSFPTDIEYNNRFSFYRLVFALVGFGRKGHIEKLLDPSAKTGGAEVSACFAQKTGTLKGYGHTLRIRINQKQQILENSIAKEVNNENRLKNF